LATAGEKGINLQLKEKLQILRRKLWENNCILCNKKILPEDVSPWSKNAHFACEVDLMDDPDSFFDWYWDIMVNP
jgi:hypothetical protein